MFGDINQLPPVKDEPLYSNRIKGELAVNGKKSYALFKNCAILTQKMRQQTDTRFGQFLDRVKVGECTSDDYTYIRCRGYNDLAVAPNSFNEALHIFTQNSNCNKYNITKIKTLETDNNPIAVISAEGKFKIAKKYNLTNLGSVTAKLFLTVGARVMLKVNISVKNGLVNGSMGTVKHIIYYNNAPPCIPDVVLVKFDNYTGPTLVDNCVPITAKTCEGDTANIRIIRNIPLALAYGVTIHKCQGMTLDKVVAHLGTFETQLGLAYVALSRVKSIEDLQVYYFPGDRLNIIKRLKAFDSRSREIMRLNQCNILNRNII